MALKIRAGGSPGISGSGTLNQIPIWTGATQLGDSVLREVGGTSIIVGATDPAAAATETLRSIGGVIFDTGIGHDNVVIGRGARAQAQVNNRSVVIGTLALANQGVNCFQNVVIGYNAVMPTALGVGQGGSVLLGANISWPTNTAGPAIIIGEGAFGSFPGLVIGIAASQSGPGVLLGNQSIMSAVNNAIGIGRSVSVAADGQTIVGDDATGVAGHTNAQAYGRNALTRGAGTLTFGALNLPITDVLIGEGVLSGGAAQGVIYRHSGSQGVDVAGGNVVFAASPGTGAAVGGGRFDFQTPTIGASSFIGQPLATRFQVLSTTGLAAAPILGFAGFTSGVGALAVPAIVNAPVARQPIDYIPVQTPAGQGWIMVL